MSIQSVLIVTNTQGMMVSSLKGKLTETGNSVVVVEGNVKEVTKIEVNPSVVLIYTDEALAENMQVLIYLRDRCVEESIPVFLIGNQIELDAVKNVIPRSAIAKEYVRPVNINEIFEELSTYMAEHDSSIKKKILVVDDSGPMLRNIKRWLEDKYQIILANSGAMAIKYLSINRPDLVLLDYEMPVIDGGKVLEMIRSEIDFADIPVIFLTGKNDKESVASVARLKPEGYLLKTISPEEIVKYIDDFFVKQKGTQI